MTMDQYKEQYKKETEQIHAPADLIAKTKAAMRQEEMRIRREFAVQVAGTESKGLSAVPGPVIIPADAKSYTKGFHVRKWAYPLTAAAALLILVSVSMMMRGLKSGDVSMSGAPASDMATEMETAEMSDGADMDGGMAAAGAAMDFEGTAETAEEAPADEMVSAEADMAAAPAAESENTSGKTAAVENAVSDMAGFSKGEKEAAVENAASEEAQKNEERQKFSDTERSMAEDAPPAESGAQSGSAAAAENITIEKVAKKPDFCGRSDIETHVFKGQTFRVAAEEDGWAAYVETKDGSKYVIRGEAEDLETFLEMGYRELTEQE